MLVPVTTISSRGADPLAGPCSIVAELETFLDHLSHREEVLAGSIPRRERPFRYGRPAIYTYLTCAANEEDAEEVRSAGSPDPLEAFGSRRSL